MLYALLFDDNKEILLIQCHHSWLLNHPTFPIYEVLLLFRRAPCTKTQKPRSKSPGPPDQEISGHALGEQIVTSRGTRTSPQLMILQIVDTLQTTRIFYDIIVTYMKYAEDSNGIRNSMIDSVFC